MKREQLTALGVTDEAVVNAIMNINGSDIESYKALSITQKATIDDLQARVTGSEEKLKAYDGVDVSALKAERETLKATIKQLKVDNEQAIEAVRRDASLEQFLGGYKFTSNFAREGIKSTLVGLNMEFKDGKFTNIEDEMKKLQESMKDCFVVEQQQGNPQGRNPQFTSGMQNGGNQSVDPTEYLKQKYGNNPFVKSL